jgi:dTDP-4-amino-4,6-dideoxygalactose transaminase
MQEKALVNVPLLDLGVQHKMLASEIEAAVRNVLESQQFILGPEVRSFEEELSTFCGCSYAVGCASGSDALLLALMAIDVGVGDEVITTPYTFFATAGAIVRVGAKPVFVDIDPITFNIDSRRIENAITAKTKVIMPVHLFGQCAEMDVINDIARKYNLLVIEDAAQAIGAEFNRRRAGSLGVMAAFSFYPSKNLGGAGDGGAVTTDDPRIAERLRSLRAHGAKKKYYHDEVGINSRLDSLQAAILRVKLRYLESWADARRENARRYHELFETVGLVGSGLVRLPAAGLDGIHIYNQYVLRVADRDRLRGYLRGRGIGTEIYYPVPLHLQGCFRGLGYPQGSFPEAELASEQSLAIPIYPELSERSQEQIVDLVSSFYRS